MNEIIQRMNEIRARKAEIRGQLEQRSADVDLGVLETELTALNTEYETLEQRKRLLEGIAGGTVPAVYYHGVCIVYYSIEVCPQVLPELCKIGRFHNTCSLMYLNRYKYNAIFENKRKKKSIKYKINAYL